MFDWNPGVLSGIEISGCRLEATCYGPSPADAPTVVLLHEGLGCIDLWRSFPESLSNNCECGVFVWSRAGYGASSPTPLPRPLNYMSIEATDVLPRVLDAAKIDKCILLGHSDGASIAAINAGSCADKRVRGLVLIAPHFFTEAEALTSISQAREKFSEGGLRTQLAKYHKDVDNAFYGWCDAWLDAKFKSWDISENIDYVRVPVLAIQGADDQYGTLAQLEVLEERCYAPVETLILPDCKHSPHLEIPHTVVEVVSDFAARLSIQESTTGLATK